MTMFGDRKQGLRGKGGNIGRLMVATLSLKCQVFKSVQKM